MNNMRKYSKNSENKFKASNMTKSSSQVDNLKQEIEGLKDKDLLEDILIFIIFIFIFK